MKRIIPFIGILLFFFSCKKQALDPETLPDAYSNQAIGASANDLLSGAKYTTLTIQVQYMPGYPLDTATVNNITSYLSALCNKPGGITITQSAIGANGNTLNLGQVAVLEKQNRTSFTSGKTLALYVMVTDGLDTSATVLGFAFRNTSICLFGKDITNNSGGLGQVSRASLQTSVLEHELGHLMGLVNLGSPMQTPHQDAAHGNHCSNTACLMYWEIETHNAFHSPMTSIPTLDENCLKDLTANGGK